MESSQLDPSTACSLSDASSNLASSSTAAAGCSSPVCLIVLGMAGSGKTTFVQRLTASLHEQKSPPYVINLDPAVKEVPFPVNIDIRDTVNYKEVMKQYGLGPNGAIMTSLNLFTTKFDEVLNILSKRAGDYKYVIFDTPGQIEVFTWSASGSIVTESLAALYPTIAVYVMDVARSISPITFMSNMLYACSILYRTKLPFIIVLNKSDIVNPSFSLEWMKDFEAFGEALEQEQSYMSDLTRSLSLVLDEFYKDLKTVAVSSVLGEGIPEFISTLDSSVEEYFKVYRVELEKYRENKNKAQLEEQTQQLERVKLDCKISSCPGIAKSSRLDGQRIFIGTTDDEEPIADNDDEEKEKLEDQSFKRFLSRDTSDK